MKEKLQEYALLAEIIGALAVVISLIYVGSEVRQNTKAKGLVINAETSAIDPKRTLAKTAKFTVIPYP